MAEAGEEFTFKQALLRGPVSVRVDKQAITVTRGRRIQRAEFASVTDIYVHAPADMESRAIEIATQAGERVRYTTTTVMTARSNQQVFLRSTAALLRAWSNARPGAQARLGTSRAANVRVMAIVAVVLLLVWLVQSLWDRRIDTIEWVLLPVFMGAVAWIALTRFSVLKDPPGVPAVDLAAAFAQAADPMVS